MDGDLNKYDLEHACTAHARMSKAEWEQIYQDAWTTYYTPEHIETILRRARTCGINIFRLAQIILWFSQSIPLEKVHPLQGGIFRKKTRFERRSGLPVEPVWRFYPKLAWDFASKTGRVVWEGFRMYRIYRRVAADPDGMAYMDQAMTAPADDEVERLELFTHNKAARDAVDHARKVHELTRNVA
jgi:hypothetical protein